MGSLFALSLAVIAIAAVDGISGGALRNAARPLLVPFADFGRASIAAVSSGDFLESRAALIEENAQLRAERDRLVAEGAAFAALRADIESLSRMANVVKSEATKGNEGGVSAPVISSFRSSPYGTFLVGVGRLHGVNVGSLVLGDGGFVVGVVSDVSDASSVVRMVFAPGQTIDVVSGATGFSIRGRGGGNASAEVSREAPLEENDPVFAPTLGNRPVGVIGEIASSSASAYAEVYVVFPQNLNSIRYVHVVPVL